MDDVLHRGVTQLVRRAIDRAALHAAATEEHRETLHVMVATGATLVRLRHRRAPELAAPHDERVVEHPALLEVRDERGGRAVHVGGVALDELHQVVVMVPVAVIKLDETHAALRQSPREQAVRRERAIARFAPVGVEHVLRLVCHVHEAGHRRLHLEGQLVLRDARGQLRVIVHDLLRAVQRLHGRDHVVLLRGGDAGRAVQVEHRVALRAHRDALELAGEKPAVPLPHGNRLRAAALRGSQHHEAGQILALAAEAVEHPRTHRGPSLYHRARVHQRVRRVVVDGVRLHRADDREFVRDRSEVREDFRKLRAALPAALEGKLRRKTFQRLLLQLRELLSGRERLRHRLPVELRELRFGVERLQVRRSARHVEPDDALGTRREVERIHYTRPARGLGGISGEAGAVQQRGQRRHTEAGAPEESAAPQVGFGL